MGCIVSVTLSTAIDVSGPQPMVPLAAMVDAEPLTAAVTQARPASITELKQRVAMLEGENTRLSHQMSSLMGSDGVLERVIDRLRVLQGRDEVLRQNVVDIISAGANETDPLSALPGDPGYDPANEDPMTDPSALQDAAQPLVTRARHSQVTRPTPAPRDEVAAEVDVEDDDPDAAEQAAD